VYRILVVEDIAENRHLLVTLLETVGFEVRAVVNGRQAIAMWSEWQPHLIWMDIQMPELNGYEATREIRSRSGGDAVVIIALTASAFGEDSIASKQAGCNDWVIKPFVENTIFEKIASYLGVSYCYSHENMPKPSSLGEFQRPLTAEDLQIMPRQWIDQVHQATLVLDDVKLYHLIAQIPNPHLAHALKYLVDNFQLEAIASITQDLGENP
jgi:CheY-like chemotaxis protein